MLDREFFSTVTGKQDVRRMLHHLPRDGDRMFESAHKSHRPAPRGGEHDAGVETVTRPEASGRPPLPTV